MKKETSETRNERIRTIQKVHMLVMDVDGVLTEGGIVLGEGDQEFKVFNVQDGMGITLARMGGLKVGIITGRRSQSVERRARELHFDVLYQGVANKLDAYNAMLKENHFLDENICYVGDDLLDIPVMERSGFAVAVANAREEVKKCADYVTEAAGGKGAVREVVEFLLKSQKKWDSVLGKVIPKTGTGEMEER